MFYICIYFMKLSIVIPTRGDQNMKNIIACLQEQTFKDFEVHFILDRTIMNYELRIADCGLSTLDGRFHFITNLNSSFRTQRDDKEPMIGGNASTLRNYWIKAAKGEFILLMDDDERFEDDYLKKNIEFREKYRKIIKKDFVLTPTLMYRKTGHVQNYGFSHFDFRLSRPIPLQLHKERDYIQMYSGNSLFAPAHIFQQILFDEQLDFVYEDLDFTYRIHRAGYPIIVLRDLKICHMERDKTKLEEARVGNEYAAYRKSKHRIIFVRKYGSLLDKIKFYAFGFLGQPVWLIGKVLLYGKNRPRWRIIRAIIRGTFS